MTKDANYLKEGQCKMVTAMALASRFSKTPKYKFFFTMAIMSASLIALPDSIQASTNGASFKTQSSQESKSVIVLPSLPYGEADLEPYITKSTLEFHYGKHHKGYVDALNSLISEGENKNVYEEKPLEEIILLSHKGKIDDPKMGPVFNNSAQVWNHTFYWKSMKKDGGGEPTGALLQQINKDFGSYAEFKKKFVEAGVKQFGSGWVWLVMVQEKGEMSLKIMSTGNADNPLVDAFVPLLTCDIWEHAYYLDYQNRRKDYVEVFLDHLVNWDFAQSNFDSKS